MSYRNAIVLLIAMVSFAACKQEDANMGSGNTKTAKHETATEPSHSASPLPAPSPIPDTGSRTDAGVASPKPASGGQTHSAACQKCIDDMERKRQELHYARVDYTKATLSRQGDSCQLHAPNSDNAEGGMNYPCDCACKEFSAEADSDSQYYGNSNGTSYGTDTTYGSGGASGPGW